MKTLISGSRVVQLVKMISGYNRNPGSSDYREVLGRIEEHLVQEGVESKSIRRISFPADGKPVTKAMISTVGWQPNKASLWVTKPEMRFITSTRTVPISLLVGSCPSGGPQELELVEFVGSGDYRDKAVLAEGNMDEVFETACVQGGARCIVIYSMRNHCEQIGRTPEMLMSATNFLRLKHDRESSTLGVFGFSVDYGAFLFLRDLVRDGETKVCAEVDSLIDGNASSEVMEIDLTGGARSCYSMITSHLCHGSPGANDNASGAALAVEIAIVLSRESLPPPVRIVLVPEYMGSVPYAIELKRQQALPKVAINLDMVGEDQDQTGSSLFLSESPPVLNQRFDNVLFYNLMKRVPKFDSIPLRRLYKIPFSAGSDHCAFLLLGVPTPFIGHLPDRYYHTDLDTPDKCDPDEIEWIGEAVIQSLKDFDCESSELSRYLKSRQLGDFSYLCEKIKGGTFSNQLLNLLAKTHEIPATLLSVLCSEDYSESVYERISPVFESSIGFEWISSLPGEEWDDFGNKATLGEFVNIVAAVTRNRSAIEQLAAGYYSLEREQVSKFVSFLVRSGLLESGGVQNESDRSHR